MSTYEYSPSTAKAFAQDERIALPRFQRKVTWDGARDFVLAISVFKGYPLGVVVLNETSTTETGLVKWLLDGRQRRTAFIQMLENPENIYDWARKFLKIKKSDKEADITEKFWDRVREQLGTDAEASPVQGSAEEVAMQEDEQTSEDDLSEPGEISVAGAGQALPATDPLDRSMGHLSELLEIVLAVHFKKHDSSDYTRPFYFKKLAEHLDYVEGKLLNGKVLTALLASYIRKFPLVSEWSPVTFADFVSSEYRLKKKEGVSQQLEAAVVQNWNQIRQRISIVMKISNRLEVAKIGLVSLHGATHRDAQYTFKIINTQGVPLSSAEVSSADPHWNIKVSNPSVKLKERSASFYRSIDIKSMDACVRWDSAATLLYALGESGRFRFFNATSPLGTQKTPGESEDDINYGFKLLSAIQLSSVNRTEVGELPKLSKDRIDWAHVADELVSDFDDIGTALLAHPYFTSMQSWNLSLKSRYGDTPSICVATILYNDWIRKERPTTRGSRKNNQFIKNAFFEFDRLAFESISKKWKSASDTVLFNKLKDFNAERKDLLDPVEESDWRRLLEEMFDSHSVGGVNIGDQTLSSVFEIFLAHHVCMSRIQVSAVDEPTVFSVDHVIPVSFFEASPMAARGIRIGNLVPIPKKLNSIKNNRPINKMVDADARRYAAYSLADYEKISLMHDCNDFDELSKMLRLIYIDSFLAKRRALADA
jgi:hypothetical protein